MPTIDKKLIINLLPFIAAAVWLVGMFLPLQLGDLAVVGFGAGLALRAILPYYVAWKENNELLVFNYAYLMPIIVLIAGAVVSGLAGIGDYLTVAFGATSIPQLLYAGATVFAYGGYDMFNGFRKWWPFLEGLWETKQLDLVELVDLISPEEEAPVEPTEETPSLEDLTPPVSEPGSEV
jgi:hypothetical protein